MATLLLGAVGTLVGGPLGGSIGALLGQRIDQSVIGGPKREGPRLDELSVSSSTYGQPIARHYGRMRTAGSIIWSTDLREHSETSGGKGKPKTRTYSYSVSLAVLLASRPIDGIGRIWADGNLLRGAAGDLKTGGVIRIHTGHADQAVDPLLAAALGARCPAHRGHAYVVFEDLQLEDFGNRIPALTFEVLAGTAGDLASDVLARADAVGSSDLVPAGLEGYSYRDGTVAQVMQLLDVAMPLGADPSQRPLSVQRSEALANPRYNLPQASAWEEGEFGKQDGQTRSRARDRGAPPSAIRYYDVDRDYQPGLQRTQGRASRGEERTLDFPASFNAANARALVRTISATRAAEDDTLFWRLAELDPALSPGRIVRAPDLPGLWRIAAWEWREGGIELELKRFLPASPAAGGGDAGLAWSPLDRLPAETLLRAFELPWDGFGSPEARRVFAAVGATVGRWSGASLHASREGSLIPLGEAPPRRAVLGALSQPLAPSRSHRIDPHAVLEVVLADAQTMFEPADVLSLARGGNRLLVGEEVVQFLGAQETAPGQWLLGGLLRGRGGSEVAAQQAHPAGTAVTLIDERLTTLDPAAIDPANDSLAAIGLADAEPIQASIENAGASLKPLTPVHPRATFDADGSLNLSWTRRARGSWAWQDEVDVPLVEQQELYQIGIGSVSAPFAQWMAASPNLQIDGATLANLAAAHPGANFWVRQVGSHARSNPLLLTTLLSQ
ncbi:MAG: phage tail baseplate protein [Qipengyuania sp.]